MILFVCLFLAARAIFSYLAAVTITGDGAANFGLCSALRAFEQGGIFIVPHQLRHGTSVYTVSSERPLQPWLLTLTSTRLPFFIMVTKRTINCKILEITFWSQYCPTRFFYLVILRPWPLTSDPKNNSVLRLMMLIKYTKLYDPGVYGSVSLLPEKLFYKVMLRPWPLSLKNSRIPPLINGDFKCAKLNDPEAYGLVSILITSFF
jgi:hypothetical protein